MSSFVKLYGSILTSSVWVEPDHIFRVWITMLVLADKNGLVEGTPPGLASIARVSLDDCIEALEKFKQPDPHSRSKNDDGRRIEEVDGGWRLINHEKYREMRTETQVRTAERVRRWREKQPAESVTCNASNAPYTDTDTDTENRSSSSSSGIVDSEFEPDLTELLTRVAGTPSASTTAWLAELRVARDGMHGPARTPQQIGQAVRDFNAAGGEISLRLFRGYLRGTVVAEKTAGAAGGGTNGGAKKWSGKKPWEEAAEREARDKRLNLSPEIQQLVSYNRQVLGDEWWEKILADARAADRWVVPYAYDILMEEGSNAARA